MAKLDWSTVRGKLDLALPALTGIEEILAQRLLDTLDAVGVPYYAVYTSQIDANKVADDTANAKRDDDWAAEATTAHDQATNALNYIESAYTDLSSITYPSFDSTPSTVASNRVLIGGKLSIYAAKTQSTANAAAWFNNEGMPQVLIDVRDEFYAAYDARPTPQYTGDYGVTPLVAVPGKGLLTIQQTEDLLQSYVDQSERLLQIINYP